MLAFPRRNGMDTATRRRYLEGIALGLQQSCKHAAKQTRAATPNAAHQIERARQQAETELKIAQDKAREEGQRRAERVEEEDNRRRREDEVRRKSGGRAETPQQALRKIYYPIFKKLWEMEFPSLGGTNPFRIVIDRDNCASLGAPNYFDIVKKPMNLTWIQQKVDRAEYTSLQSFFQDIELMITNAMLYNSDLSNPYRKAAEDMKKLYRKIAKKVVLTLQQNKQQGAKR
jgi:Bromodomain